MIDYIQTKEDRVTELKAAFTLALVPVMLDWLRHNPFAGVRESDDARECERLAAFIAGRLSLAASRLGPREFGWRQWCAYAGDALYGAFYDRAVAGGRVITDFVCPEFLTVR